MESGLKYDPQCDKIRHALEFRNFLVVNGPPSIGKTTLVKYILAEYQSKYVFSYTLCDLVTSTTELYSQIINDLTKGMKPRSLLAKKVVGHQDFANKFDELLKMAIPRKLKLVVILDRPESFKKSPMFDTMDVMATILGLKLIMITCQSGQSIIDGCFKSLSTKASLQFRLSQFTLSTWTKNDIVQEISKYPPSKSPELYKKFVNNMVQILYNSKTHNMIELKGICQDEFASFLNYYLSNLREFVRSKEPETSDMSDEEVDRFIKKLDISAAQETKFIASFFDSYRKSKSIPTDEYEVKRTSFKMASLIVAAFIAAHSTPANDKRNFVKFQKRKQKSGKSDQVHDSNKTFSAERLLHVQKALENYSSGTITTDEVSDISDADILRVKQLERERIITPVGCDGLDTSVLYKLSKNVTRQYAQKLALNNLELDLENFYGLS